MSLAPFGINFIEMLIKSEKPFIHGNASENIVCEMTILSRVDELIVPRKKTVALLFLLYKAMN